MSATCLWCERTLVTPADPHCPMGCPGPVVTTPTGRLARRVAQRRRHREDLRDAALGLVRLDGWTDPHPARGRRLPL